MSVKDLSLKELLELADKGLEGNLDASDKKLLDKSSVGRYVKERGLMDGTDLIPTYVIYHDYCKGWSRRGKKESKIGFFKKFNAYFDQHRKTKQRYYLLDGSKFDLTPEGIEKAKLYVKRREAQTITAKKRKISSSKKEVQSETEK